MGSTLQALMEAEGYPIRHPALVHTPPDFSKNTEAFVEDSACLSRGQVVTFVDPSTWPSLSRPMLWDGEATALSDGLWSSVQGFVAERLAAPMDDAAACALVRLACLFGPHDLGATPVEKPEDLITVAAALDDDAQAEAERRIVSLRRVAPDRISGTFWDGKALRLGQATVGADAAVRLDLGPVVVGSLVSSAITF